MHIKMHVPKLVKFFRGCIHASRFNREGARKGKGRGREKERRGKGKDRRYDGRKGEEGRHGEFRWGGGIAPLLLVG